MIIILIYRIRPHLFRLDFQMYPNLMQQLLRKGLRYTERRLALTLSLLIAGKHCLWSITWFGNIFAAFAGR